MFSEKVQNGQSGHSASSDIWKVPLAGKILVRSLTLAGQPTGVLKYCIISAGFDKEFVSVQTIMSMGEDILL